MKVPSIRFYLDEDYDDVKALCDDQGYEIPSREALSGASLVAHDENNDELVGFIWALAASGVPIAYIDHLVIARHLRGSSVGLILMMTLAAYLREKGVREVLAITRPYNVAFIRMLKRRGAKARGEFEALSLNLVKEEVGANGRR